MSSRFSIETNSDRPSSEVSEPDTVPESEREPEVNMPKRKWSPQKEQEKKKTEAEPPSVMDPSLVEIPTALILNFNESDALPSVADLIEIFSPHGPFREEETEVLREAKRASVVFKYHVDAEKAFSCAENFSVFGPELRTTG